MRWERAPVTMRLPETIRQCNRPPCGGYPDACACHQRELPPSTERMAASARPAHWARLLHRPRDRFDNMGPPCSSRCSPVHSADPTEFCSCRRRENCTSDIGNAAADAVDAEKAQQQRHGTLARVRLANTDRRLIEGRVAPLDSRNPIAAISFLTNRLSGLGKACPVLTSHTRHQSQVYVSEAHKSAQAIVVD